MTRRQFVLSMVFAASLPNGVFAWWGFVHYRIAKEIADTVGGIDPNYAMGPDTFPSHHLGVISVGFTWSHAVLKHDLDPPPPLVPTYPHDGRYPGRVMYELLTKKLRPETAALLEGPGAFEQDPLQTAKGFVVHNAADNVVHWEYFRGGPTPGGCSTVASACGPIFFDQYMWVTNHCDKEEWASYVVLMLKDARTNQGTGGPIRLFRGPGADGVAGTSDDIESALSEDANHNMILDPGEDQDGNGALTDYVDDVFGPPDFDGRRHLRPYFLVMHQISYKTNAKLMRLAMKVHRKNRRNSDTVGGSEESDFEVPGLSAIVSSFSSEILAGGAAMLELQNMTFERFLELNVVASEVNAQAFGGCAVPGWYPSDVMGKYDQCVNRGIAWLETLGQD